MNRTIAMTQRRQAIGIVTAGMTFVEFRVVTVLLVPVSVVRVLPQ